MKGLSIVEKELRAMKEDILKYRKGVSDTSKESERLLHFLESEKLDAVALVQVAKELKKVRQERRVWKTLLYDTELEYNILGGDQYLKKLEKARLNKVKKYSKKNQWFDNFSDEAKAILNTNSGGLINA